MGLRRPPDVPGLLDGRDCYAGDLGPGLADGAEPHRLARAWVRDAVVRVGPVTDLRNAERRPRGDPSRDAAGEPRVFSSTSRLRELGTAKDTVRSDRLVRILISPRHCATQYDRHEGKYEASTYPGEYVKNSVNFSPDLSQLHV